MKTILLTNDDGFRSPGLTALRDKLKNKFNVFTIAPASEMSAVSMALTLNRPLRVEKIDEDYYSVDGTPSDCVNIALRKLMEKTPDFVVSGMNLGENLSEDIIYSGTVGAATSGDNEKIRGKLAFTKSASTVSPASPLPSPVPIPPPTSVAVSE